MKDLSTILKYADRGLQLYTPMYGNVSFMKVNHDGKIVVFANKGLTVESFDRYGRKGEEGECLLFPSRSDKSWDSWQEVLFKNGDFISTPRGVRVITDLPNRRCVSPVGDTVWFIIRDDVVWAGEEEKSSFLDELERHGYHWDESILKPIVNRTGNTQEEDDFEKSFKEDLECYHKMKESGKSEESLDEWIHCWKNTLLELAKRTLTGGGISADVCSESADDGRTPEDDGFTGAVDRKISETVRNLTIPTVSTSFVPGLLKQMAFWVRDGLVEDLKETLGHRIKELEEIKSREEGHGITTTDLQSITGGIQEIQIILEKLENSK